MVQRIGLVAAALAALLIAAPVAAADVEPNDGITQGEGPLAGAMVYSGSLSTTNDADWYSFYVAGQTQLDVTVTIPPGGPCDSFLALARMTLLNGDGGEIAEADPDPGETQHILYTTPPGVNHYFLTATDDACAGYDYVFRLDPGAAIVGGPGVVAPAPTAEPNESAGQAFGPLAGGTPYAGRIDTQNDQDWFYFYAGGVGAFDVAATGTGGGGFCSPDVRLYAAGNTEDTEDSLVSGEIHTDATTHLAHTAGGPERYLLAVDASCIGAGYQLRLDPASLVVPALPPAPAASPPIVAKPRPSTRCSAARHGVHRWKDALQRTRAKLHAAHTRHARRALRHKVAAQRRTLHRARDRVTIYC